MKIGNYTKLILAISIIALATGTKYFDDDKLFILVGFGAYGIAWSIYYMIKEAVSEIKGKTITE